MGDGRTDRRTERPSYRDAWTHLKNAIHENFVYKPVVITRSVSAAGAPVIADVKEFITVVSNDADEVVEVGLSHRSPVNDEGQMQ